MPVLDPDANELILRVVYDGPPEAGKTTSLRALASSLDQTSVTPEEDERGRTLWFDWMEYVGGMFEGRRIRCQIVSVPGQREHGARRRAILDTADVVVFVGDTTAPRWELSLSYLRDLHTLFAADMPARGIVFQANKRDASDALPLAEVRSTLGDAQFAVGIVSSVAADGTGIREAFVYAVQLALDRVREMLRLGTLPTTPPPLHASRELLAALGGPADGTRPRIADAGSSLAASALGEVIARELGAVDEAWSMDDTEARSGSTTMPPTIMIPAGPENPTELVRALRVADALDAPAATSAGPSEAARAAVTTLATVRSAAPSAAAKITIPAPGRPLPSAPRPSSTPHVASRLAELQVDSGAHDHRPEVPTFIASSGRAEPHAGQLAPRPPDGSVPSGAIWPPVEGRAILHEVTELEPVVRRHANGDWSAGLGSGWRLVSARPATYATLDEGREALVEWARLHAACSRVISPRRAIVLAEAGDGMWRLWQIVRAEPSLRDMLDEVSASGGTDRLADALCRAARLLVDASARLAQAACELPCSLDTIGASEDHGVFIALMPEATVAPTVLERLPPAELIERELRPMLALELGAHLPDLARALTSSPRVFAEADTVLATLGRLLAHAPLAR